MGLNPNFTKFSTASPVIATYDYTDIAELTGIQVFHLFRQKETTNITYALGSDVVYSDDSDLTYPRIEMTDGNDSDDDFDLTPFNVPADIKGTGKIVIPYGAVSSAGGAGFTAIITCTLRKVTADAIPVESDIVSVVSPTITAASEQTKPAAVFNLPITIPLTHFKKGETLRLTVAITMTGGNTFDFFGYGTDPKAREVKIGKPGASEATLDSSDSQFLCPFRLNV